MKTRSFILAALLASSYSIPAATLPAFEDTSSAKGRLTTSSNRSSALQVDGNRNAFIYFNLGDLPSDAEIRYARLRIYMPRVIRAGEGLAVHRVTGTWSESLAGNSPEFDSNPVAAFEAGVLEARRFASVDITATVRAWIASPQSNQGVAIKAVSGATNSLTASLIISSKEGAGAGHPAELEVELVSGTVGVIGTAQIADGSITTQKLASGAVNSINLAQNLSLAGTTTGVFSGSGFGLTTLNPEAVNSAVAKKESIQFTEVGNPGNASDPANGVGAVAVAFRIGKFEVTNEQYVRFLNAVAATDPNALYNPSMGTDPQGGINRIGSSGSFTYSTKRAMANKPVNFVSWFDGIRFSNWVHNGMPTGNQDSSTTEDGAYTISGSSPNWTVGPRNAGAKCHLPSLDEWYKAAYFDPAKDGTGGYWNYATQSDSAPLTMTANAIGDVSNIGLSLANYNFAADWNGQNGNVVSVGSGGLGCETAYGAADMNGNVWEWCDTVLGQNRSVRGGSWIDGSNELTKGFATPINVPTLEQDNVGFRVARP